jgi:hypothetical protein
LKSLKKSIATKKPPATKLDRIAAADVAQYVYELARTAAALSPNVTAPTTRAAT